MGSQAPLGKENLWDTAGVHLPGPIREVARALMREQRYSKSRAIATAVSRAKAWAAKGNTKFARAVAQWEAARAKAKATPNKTAHPQTRHGLALAAQQEAAMADFDIAAMRTALAQATAQVDALALAMPPALAKANAKKKSPTSAKSTVQVPEGQEAAFKALVEKIMKRPGMTRDKAEKAAAAILRNRKAPGGKTTAKAS